MILHLAVRGEQADDLTAGGGVGGVADIGGDTRHRVEHIDGGVVALLGEGPGKDDVAVEDTAGGVGHRLGHLVTLHKDGVDAGD